MSVSLLLVFVLSKMAVLWGHFAPSTGWALIGYFWQDVLVALAFAAIEKTSVRVARALYCALVIYAAINIPVGRVLSTPLTPPMLCGARSLGRFYLRLRHCGQCVACLIGAVGGCRTALAVSPGS